MADPALQALLDPAATGMGATILRRVNADTLTSYYVQGLAGFAGRARWVNVTTSDSDAQKNTAIRAALIA